MPPPGSFMRTAARNDDKPTPSVSSPVKLTLATRNLQPKSSLSRDENSASFEAHRPPRTSSRQKLKDHTDMSHSSSSPLNKSSSTGNHAKLHKRGGSASSLPGPPSPFTNGQFHTPFATYEESSPDVPTPPLGSSVPKIKPYLRKMSAAKEDQGMIDLSKSAVENERLNGLGIQEFGSKSAADVSFAHTRRGQQQHGRTTSGASQGSNGSGGFRPGQPFTHPMAKTPRPYTPPTGSYANSINEDESDDVVEDDFRLGAVARSRRSISISSTAQPTPLSQSHTASDLGLIPKLTSNSQTNLSLKSAQSSTGRPRRNTDRSQEYVPSPSSRTSFDKTFSFVKRSDLDPQTRDEMIREARRKFEEKEASKEGKRRVSESKRQRQKSEPTLKSAMKQVEEKKKSRKDSAATAHAGAEDVKGRHRGHDFQAMSYEEQRPAILPRHGSSPGESERRLNEKGPQFTHTARPDAKDGGWMRFSTWIQTRMLSCGGSRD